MKNHWLQKSKVFKIGDVVEYIGNGFDGFMPNNSIRFAVKTGTKMSVSASHDGIGVDCQWFEGSCLKYASFVPNAVRRC